MILRIHNTLPALTLLLASLAPAAAATVSYTNDFSGTGGNTALPVEVTDSQWELSAGSYVNTVSSGAIVVSSAALEITNAPSVPVLTLRTQFTVPTVVLTSTGTSTIGFGLFSSTDSFSGTSPASYYLADFAFADSTVDSNEGRLRILSLGAANGDFSGGNTFANLGFADDNATANVAVNAGTTYSLLLTATRTGTALSFTLGLYDATGTTQIGTTAIANDPSALTGTFFGYRNRYEPNANGTVSVAFDNLAIVPEPGITVLGLLSLGLLWSRRRPS